MFRNRYQSLSKIEKRAFWISLVVTAIYAIFTSTVLDAFIPAPNVQYRLVSGIPFLLALISLISAFLIFSNNVSIGSWLIQIGTITLLSLIVTQAEGYGFPSAFIILAITLYIPTQTLKGQNASRSLWGGIIGTIGIIVLDSFWLGLRIPTLAEDTLLANTLAIIFSLILLIISLRQFAGFTLRTKLLILSLGTGIVSIVLVSLVVITNTQRTLTQKTQDSLVSSARRAMNDVDDFLRDNVLSMSADVYQPEFTTYLKASDEKRDELLTGVISQFNKMSLRYPEYRGIYSLLDRNGVNVADTQQNAVGVDLSNRDYFLQPRANGNIFISPAVLLPTTRERVLYIGAPIIDTDGVFLGILRIQLPFSYINGVIINNELLVGEESYLIMLDRDDLILAHTKNPDWVSRTLVKPDLPSFLLLKNNGRILKNVLSEDIALDMLDFATKLDSVTTESPFFTSSDETWGAPVEIGVAQSTMNTDFMIAYVLPQAVSLAGIDQQVQVTIIAALLTAITLLFVSFYTVRIITQPIINLSVVAEDIASGNLSSRADYAVEDEIGTLANSFNRMTSQLQDTLGGLERRVAERTADVELARLLSERRAQELQSISEISRTISTEQRLDVLLPLISRIVSERFDFYHVGIFFVDDTGRFAYLQAANSEGGQKMLARGHRLEVGKGLVGTVAQAGKTRIALDVGSDAAFFDNPDLPETRSEMALPLNFRGKTIGVLDVQSTDPGAFTENDAATLGILGDQVAIAIENARLFGQTQQAREEAEALYSQIQQQAWAAFNKQSSSVGYRQTPTGGKSLEKTIETDETRQAIENGQVVVYDGKGKKATPTIAVPVKLRGQTLGVLNIKAPTKDRKWSKNEINLAQAVSDRLALALDNARLLHESQRRAAKEAKIGEVSAKIGASINMRNVLETAVEELGRALPGSDVLIQFQSKDNEDNPQENQQESLDV